MAGDREDKTTRKRKPVSEEDDDLENPSGDEDKVKKIPPRSAWKIVGQVVLVICGLFFLYIAFVTSPIEPIASSSNDPLPYFDGVMTPNYKLQKITRIGLNKLLGPESIELDKEGNIYTGLNDGRIMKITVSGDLVELARTGERLPQCGQEEFEDQCGRPLGLKLDHDEQNLIICDAYFGLLNLNMHTFKLTTLISSDIGIDGHAFKFVNDLTISKSGIIYFTDSSWKWNRRDFPYLILEGGGQGRVISYDKKSGETKVLLHGLFFANGIELSPDEDFLLVCETSANRIVRYYLSGKKEGIYDLFADNLPGFPDNIKASQQGGYWIGLSSARKWPFSFLDFVGPYPRIRSVLSKILPKHMFNGFVKKYGLIIKLDYYGDIIKSLHDPDGTSISFVSEVKEDLKNKVLYLGSFKNNFLGKYRLDEEDLQEE